MYFDTGAGWLRYRPFSTYSLPRLVRIDEKNDKGKWRQANAEFQRKQQQPGDQEESWTEPLYRLEWPGWREEADTGNRVQGDGVPTDICYNWPGVERVATEDGNDQNHLSLGWLKEQGLLPEVLPESVAYHLAVNQHAYGKFDSPLCGLPARRVRQVFDVEFAVKGHHRATLAYLKWHAEGHRGHPLFTGFDTSIRDELSKLAEESARLYFYVLQDCIYDREKKWWSRWQDRHWWGRLATYLHWVGRTGTGLYESRGFPWRDTVLRERLEKEMPDVVDCLNAWNGGAQEKSRGWSHNDGHDPCVGRVGEEPTGPVL